MRNAFANAMTALSKERSDVCLLSGDIGNRMFDHFKENAASRFINCGIAEANMMSMAAGMALSGLRPVVYTIAPFTTTRCLEQIRTGVAYHEASVVIVGTGSGLSYAELGSTHHSLEDIAVLRSIPNLQICAPVDSIELVTQLREAIQTGKPTYIRIGKKGEPDLLSGCLHVGIGRANIITPGEDFILLGIGPIINEALRAREILKTHGINLCIASMSSIKPLDEPFLKSVASDYKHWISLEEHHKSGGLGSALLEWISDNHKSSINLTRLGVEDHFIHMLGGQSYARMHERIDTKSIVDTVLKL